MTSRRQPDDAATDDARMATALMGFVRDFGLLQPDRTPCGKPLTVTQAHALTHIAERPGITQRDLGDTLGLARATTSELVTQFADRGWITQHHADTDRRQRSLELTPAGQRITDDIAAARHALMRSLLEHVPADKRTGLVDAIELLAAATHQHRTAISSQACRDQAS
jgi:DNA-binding MarR family transcriptional regulator